jgi:hypothetical protein
MRYSLLMLFAVITLVALVLAMMRMYGYFGIVLCIPHVATVGVVIYLLRHQRRKAALITAAIYLGLWGLTALVGVPHVREHVNQRIVAQHHKHFSEDGESQRLQNDLAVDGWPLRAKSPWHYVGNAHSPCPLIVVVDHAMMHYPFGSGGTSYFVWLFGHDIFIRGGLRWMV